MASKDITLTSLTLSLQKTGAGLKKHAGIVFIVIVLAALAYSISSVNSVLRTASDNTYRTQREAEATSAQFDKLTIEKIKTLDSSSTNSSPPLPAGRINPFIE